MFHDTFFSHISISKIGIHPHIDDVLDLMKYRNLLLTYFSSLSLNFCIQEHPVILEVLGKVNGVKITFKSYSHIS